MFGLDLLAEKFRDEGLLSIPTNLIADGVIHRFKDSSRHKDKAGWYVIFPVGTDHFAGSANSWRMASDIPIKANTFGKKISKEERADLKRAYAEAAALVQAEKEQRQMEVASESEEFFLSLPDCPADFPYLARKQILPFGSKISNETHPDTFNEEPCLIIPAYDIKGKIWTVQKIWADGVKRFLFEGKSGNTFYPIGELDSASEILICEGFATGASLHIATQKPAVVTFYASNLEKVARGISKKYPQASLLICGDDDQFTEKENKGRLLAEKVADLLRCRVVFPTFKKLDTKPTDFNDLHCMEGIQAVREQIAGVPEERFSIDIAGDDTLPHRTQLLENVILTPRGEVRVNLSNALQVIQNWPNFDRYVHFDEFHQKILTSWNAKGKFRELKENDELEILSFFQRDLGFHGLGAEALRQALLVHAFRHTKNEPRDWLQSLEWDGKSRLFSFFEQFMGAESNEYTMKIAINWWVSMVARIYQPGCKVDTMVILEGDQGKLKSQALKVIGGDWYATAPHDLHNKDFMQAFRGKLIIEIAELDSFSKADTNLIKKILSTPIDTYRPSYGRHVGDFPRQCIFVGTTNDSQYLKDVTGGRRFWPVLTQGEIDLKSIEKERNQLFAEAVKLYKAGEDWWIVPKSAEDEQENRRNPDAWEEIIAHWLKYKHRQDEVTVSEVALGALEIKADRIDNLVSKRIQICLRALDWFPGKEKRVDGKKRRPWYPKGTENTRLTLIK